MAGILTHCRTNIQGRCHRALPCRGTGGPGPEAEYTQEAALDPIPQPLARELLSKRGTVLLESQLSDPENTSSYLFTDPVAVIDCAGYQDVPEAIGRIEAAARAGLFAAGFISYEAGPALTPHQEFRPLEPFPLLRFGLYEKASAGRRPLLMPREDRPGHGFDLTCDVGAAEYMDGVRRIRGHIAEGETYQVNYTCRLGFISDCDPVDLYLRLRRSHPVPYGAYLRWDDFSLVSQSPELFLRKEGPLVWSRPMKGTAGRGPDPLSDRTAAESLRKDEKTRAENLMIVDLVRNDLGRVCVPGTVEVFDPFRVEPYDSLFQMTTGVKGRLREGVALIDIFRAAFPPGSVTGAPKVRTMQIIGELEPSPRRVYTGCIGAFFPDGDFVLSVAIRTVLARADGRCELGVGSGIVWDSDPEGEHSETLLKASFLGGSASEEYRLLETILLREDGTLDLLDEHLERMGRSAKALGFHFCREAAALAFGRHLRGMRGPAAVRLLLSRRGDARVEVLTLDDLPLGPVRVAVSPVRTDARSALLAHKTTERALYDRELARARSEGFAEVLFLNREGRLTEGAFTSVMVLLDGSWITPPLSCGLLPGIWRQEQIRSGLAREGLLALKDLAQAKRVVIGNSVRGSIEVNEITDPDGKRIFPAPV